MRLILIAVAATFAILHIACHEGSHHDGHSHSHAQEGLHDHHHHEHHDHQHEHDHEQQSSEQDYDVSISRLSAEDKSESVVDFFTSCQKQVDEWIYIPKQKPISQILSKCQVQQHASSLLQFYAKLSKFNSSFIKQHIDLIIKEFKLDHHLPGVLNCIVKERELENHYLDEKKKFKYMARFLQKYPAQGKDAFPSHLNFTLIGKKTCHFFKALFEFYYLEVLNPSQTLSTEFLRALTVRSPVFQHEDLAFCISIDSVGKLSEQLEDIDINNVYIKIPDIYHSLRFLKLKEKCRDGHNRKLINNLHNALEGMDMFKIMYQEYEPFVEIAAEKFVQTQIRLLARKFAEIIANRQKYLEYSNQNIQL